MHAGGVPIIIDCGSGLTKAGTAEEDVPSVVFHSCVGNDSARAEQLVGCSLESSDAEIELVHPVEEGDVVSWDSVESVWQYIFETMKLES